MRKFTCLNRILSVLVIGVFVIAYVSEGAARSTDTDAIREINRHLAELGYPIDPYSDEWSSQTQFYLDRVYARLGQSAGSVSRGEALSFLSNVADQKVFPCAKIDARAGPDGDQPYEEVEVRFHGNRPEEYLAQFYLRIAECHPWALAPERQEIFSFEAEPRDKSNSGGSPFPVHRTRRSIETYRKVNEMLARYLRQSGGAQSEWAEPAVETVVIESELRENLTEAEIEYNDNHIARITKPASLPTRKQLAQFCGKIGEPSNCIDPDAVKAFYDGQSGLPLSYFTTYEHFELGAKFHLPAEVATTIFIDAIDHTRKAYREQYGRNWEFIPSFVFSERRDKQLSLPIVECPHDHDEVPHREKCIEPAKAEELWNENIKNLNNAREITGWSSKSLHRRASEDILIKIYDPGFEDIRTQDVLHPDDNDGDEDNDRFADNCQDAIKSSGAGVSGGDGWLTTQGIYLACLKGMNPMLYDAERDLVFLPRNVKKSVDDFGHGVHTGFLVAGREQQLRNAGAHGFSKISPKRILVYNSRKTILDGIKEEHSGPDRYVNIVNHSYEKDPVNLAYGSKFREQGTEWNGFYHGGLLHIVAAALFDVPEDDDGDAGNEAINGACSEEQSYHLYCAGSFAIGLSVAPAHFVNSDVDAAASDIHNWALIKNVSTADGEMEYFYAAQDVMWVAAPGNDLLSADVRKSRNKSSSMTGMRIRMGSSMAAPIVTALAAHLSDADDGRSFVTPSQIKLWILANATHMNGLMYCWQQQRNNQFSDDCSPELRAESQLAGMVNFNRSVNGAPDSVNIWENCPKVPTESDYVMIDRDSNECLRNMGAAREVYYDPSIKTIMETEYGLTDDGWGIFSIWNGGDEATSTDSTPSIWLLVGKTKSHQDTSNSRFLVTRKIRLPQEESLECSLFNTTAQESKHACFFYKSRREVNAKPVDIDFNSITHVIGIGSGLTRSLFVPKRYIDL